MTNKSLPNVLKTILLLICSLCLFSFCYVIICGLNQSNSRSLTVQNEIEFYKAFLYAKQNSSRILVDALIPVEWGSMIVFPAYTTAEQKIKHAGYEYADDLISVMEYEDMVSLLFMRGSDVVYYIDAILPRMFKYSDLNNGSFRMTLQGCSVDISEEVYPDFLDWAFYPQIDIVSKNDDPYIDISYRNNDMIVLVLDCE